MRPIDFISQLEETIAESFVRNTLKWRGVQAGLDWLNEDNPRWIGGNQILFGGFPWSASDEGRKFWNAICGLYGRKSYYPLTEQDLADWSNIFHLDDESDIIHYYYIFTDNDVYEVFNNFYDALVRYEALGRSIDFLCLTDTENISIVEYSWVLNRGQDYMGHLVLMSHDFS